MDLSTYFLDDRLPTPASTATFPAPGQMTRRGCVSGGAAPLGGTPPGSLAPLVRHGTGLPGDPARLSGAPQALSRRMKYTLGGSFDQGTEKLRQEGSGRSAVAGVQIISVSLEALRGTDTIKVVLNEFAQHELCDFGRFE